MFAKRVRVLVVDDFGAWRRLICSNLEQQPQLCLVGDAADGSEALRKIKDLQPDLIVLDISLPDCNGLDVTSRVRELSPNSKVLIVSGTQSADVAAEAFRRGALGYVVKLDAAEELLPAVAAVLDGTQFVSTHLIGMVLEEPEKTRALPSRNLKSAARHEVEFYPDVAAYETGMAHCIESKLKSGDPVILFANVSHRPSILRNLKANGVDIDALVDGGRVFLPDPLEALSNVMLDGRPDAIRCEQALVSLINAATGTSISGSSRVTFCGQVAPALLNQGNTEGAIQIEHLWDEITLAYGADTLCGYILSELPDKDRAEITQRICAEHSRVHGLESGC